MGADRGLHFGHGKTDFPSCFRFRGLFGNRLYQKLASGRPLTLRTSNEPLYAEGNLTVLKLHDPTRYFPVLTRKFFLVALSLFLVAAAGCKKPASDASADSQVVAGASPTVAQTSPSQPAATQPSAPVFDACPLITGEEIEAIMGSPVKDAKASERSSTGLRVSQCFYTAAEFSSSVSLAVTQTDATNPGKQSAREFWKESLGRYSKPEENREPEKEKKEKPGKEEEKEASPPKKVEGVGEEAYWAGTRVGGTLYVLKNDAFLRISVGGADTDEKRLEKCKALAEKALPRL